MLVIERCRHLGGDPTPADGKRWQQGSLGDGTFAIVTELCADCFREYAVERSRQTPFNATYSPKPRQQG